MKREELIAYDRWLTENKWGGSEIVTPEQAADLYLAEHPLPPAEGADLITKEELINLIMDHSAGATDNVADGVCYKTLADSILKRLSLPPAEGAEAILKEGLDDGRYADIVDGINIDVKQPFYQAIIRYAEDVVAAQPQPTAEGAELKDDKPCNKCTYNGHTTICEQCNDGNDYEHFTYNDPYSKESMNFFKVFIKARKDLCAISPTETYSLEEAIRKAFDGFFPQPTAEGAEEYLKLPQNDGKLKYCPAHFLPILIRLMEGFATLHAQRIAEKMVSERMKKVESLLNMAAGLVGNPCTNISSSRDIACDDWQGEYNEYLKSKEK